LMKNCSYGVNTVVLLSGLSKVTVLSIVPCSCRFWRMCSANVDCGLLFLIYLKCSWYWSFRFGWFDLYMKVYTYCRLIYRFHFCHKLLCYYGFWLLWVVKWYCCIWRQSSHQCV
jgi:hypothetical protein